MTDTSPPSPAIPLWAEAAAIYNEIKNDIKDVPYDNIKFKWGRVKSLSNTTQQKWRDAFAGKHNISDVGVSHFTSETDIHYEPHGIILAPFSDITLQPLDTNNKAYKVPAGYYVPLHSKTVKLLSGEVDMIVASLKSS